MCLKTYVRYNARSGKYPPRSTRAKIQYLGGVNAHMEKVLRMFSHKKDAKVSFRCDARNGNMPINRRPWQYF